jgi:hypothetical protein
VLEERIVIARERVPRLGLYLRDALRDVNVDVGGDVRSVAGTNPLATRAPPWKIQEAMPEWFQRLVARVSQVVRGGGLWWGLAISLGLAVASLAVAAVVVVGWPADRFELAGPRPAPTGSPVVRALARVGKNLAGVVLFLLGVVMALPGVPGQGVLTMIIALTLIDFPGKLAFERKLVQRPFVLRQLNALRTRFRRAPLTLD